MVKSDAPLSNFVLVRLCVSTIFSFSSVSNFGNHYTIDEHFIGSIVYTYAFKI
jgi:hypothetical protein